MKIFFSEIAEFKLQRISVYLLENWGIKTRDKFILLLKDKLSQLTKYPYSCPESSRKKGVFKCVLTKQITFFYRIKNDEIEIITFFDTRQNPEKVDKEI
ncbi:type II toxin-antitoxin system RelE/ParE family toxin [Zunongwangia atlantica]|uniref:Plasmid stabilization system n=1 Tax=Zunongwangia atlantica 22II14-10F7 TaxID=1185767 RepID=A0A1Y1T7H0_9FLAO|nr:type II toxin-antitoxin system RelE/ParE family toxin [Zunongwangia atlantica]ORL46990.1 plasmid stabilization system [Zunongwangia atlantica 22II14-10F7]